MKRRNGFCTALTIALVIAAQPAAWSQRCQVTEGGVKFGACMQEGAACGTPALPGTCITHQRNDSVFHCNCVDSAGGIIPSGQPGLVWSAAITGPFEATTTVAIKELNTGSKSVSSLQSFIVYADGTNKFSPVPTLNPGQSEVQFFDVATPQSVILGITGPSLSKAIRFDGVSPQADGSLLNVPNDDWTEKTRVPHYFQPIVELSSFAPTTVLGPYAASSNTPTSLFEIYNNQFSDQAYTINVVDDSGNTNSSTSLTVPLGQIGTATLSTLTDYHLTISGGLGIAATELGWQNLHSSPKAGPKPSH